MDLLLIVHIYILILTQGMNRLELIGKYVRTGPGDFFRASHGRVVSEFAEQTLEQL